MPIELATFVAHVNSLPFPVGGAQNTIQSRKGKLGLFLSELHRSNDDHNVVGGISKTQLDAGLDPRLAERFRIVDERLTGILTRRQRSCDRVLQTFDDGSSLEMEGDQLGDLSTIHANKS